MNVKFRISMTTVPAAAFGILHSPAIGSGPVADCFSEKQLANARLPEVIIANAARVAVFRERNPQPTALFRCFAIFAPDTYRRLLVFGARARGQCGEH